MNGLVIEDLSVKIGDKTLIDRINLSIEPRRTMGVVGESGSGKSLTALASIGLLPSTMRASGYIQCAGHSMLELSETALCRVRGRDVAMVFQEPMTALNPVMTIGNQVREGILWHQGVNRADAEAQTRVLLTRVGLPPEQFPLERYPHQLSGGQRQRVAIAMACALQPKILIADEPTTALDVVLQAQILELLRELVDERDMGLLLISHDLAVVANMCDELSVMRYGKIVDQGSSNDVLRGLEHPYTKSLLTASTHIPTRSQQIRSSIPLIVTRGLSRQYPGKRVGLLRRTDPFVALDNVDLTINEGETVALVGRSGCGKSTLARLLLGLDVPSAGTIELKGQQVDTGNQADLRALRPYMSIVFQDPYGSFNPRHKAEWLVGEPLNLITPRLSAAARTERVSQAMIDVGLSIDDMEKFPHEFSGGQRQRLAIARAIITKPRFIVADEPVSALDVSIRAQIMDLFAALADKFGIAFLFITHDLYLARGIAKRVLIMDKGKIVEQGVPKLVLNAPQSKAGLALVAAARDLHEVTNLWEIHPE